MPVRIVTSSLSLAFALTLVPLVATLVRAPLSEVLVMRPALLPHVEGELLIKFRPDVKDVDRLDAQLELGATSRHRFQSGAEYWLLGPGITVEEALTRLERNEFVEYAEPNAIGSFHTLREPYDEFYSSQWAPPKIQAPDAWGITIGSPSVVVAVIDVGVNRNHPDLAANMWTNAAECNGDPNWDDDGNGYPDDCNGWDFLMNDNNPNPIREHGTQIAGIIGADAIDAGEPPGIAGLNWDVRIMNLRVGGQDTQLAHVAAAIEYAAMNGAHIINASWGFACGNSAPCHLSCHQTMRNAIKFAAEREVLVVASAGNFNLNMDDPDCGNDLYPASFDLPNVIAVAATDPNDKRWEFAEDAGSNYGAVTVDLGAPGVDIFTTTYNPMDVGEEYTYFTGTSAAAPHVAGVAALIKSLNLGIPHELVRARILDLSSVDQVSDLDPNGDHPTVTGGRLNAFMSIDDHESTAPTAIQNLAAPTRTPSTVTLTWNATGDDGTAGTAALHKIRYSTSSITDSNWLLATPVGGEPVPGDPNTAHSMVVSHLSCSTTYYFRLRAYDEWGNGPLSNQVSKTTSYPLCQTSYCKYEEFRCINTGCGTDGCCTYGNCFEDPTCTELDSCPPGACSC